MMDGIVSWYARTNASTVTRSSAPRGSAPRDPRISTPLLSGCTDPMTRAGTPASDATANTTAGSGVETTIRPWPSPKSSALQSILGHVTSAIRDTALGDRDRQPAVADVVRGPHRVPPDCRQ